jgi:hypothetical protein
LFFFQRPLCFRNCEGQHRKLVIQWPGKGAKKEEYEISGLW